MGRNHSHGIMPSKKIEVEIMNLTKLCLLSLFSAQLINNANALPLVYEGTNTKNPAEKCQMEIESEDFSPTDTYISFDGPQGDLSTPRGYFLTENDINETFFSKSSVSGKHKFTKKIHWYYPGEHKEKYVIKETGGQNFSAKTKNGQRIVKMTTNFYDWVLDTQHSPPFRERIFHDFESVLNLELRFPVTEENRFPGVINLVKAKYSQVRFDRRTNKLISRDKGFETCEDMKLVE